MQGVLGEDIGFLLELCSKKNSGDFMVFSSTIFLFCFLPILMMTYFSCPRRFNNIVLLFFSLLFYAWGEGTFVFIMIIVIVVNYIIAMGVEKHSGQKVAKFYVAFGVVVNLSLLILHKYADFIIQNINVLMDTFDIRYHLKLTRSKLPIGISFFTFQAISYLVDVYRRITPAQRNVLNLGLYISLFPQLIAGPIVRYQEIAQEISRPQDRKYQFGKGIDIFIVGLAKKVLIANNVALAADQIFAIDPQFMSPQVAWLGIFCYAIQIYFDFSGYSDMAIGLGKIFGFSFPQNFNFPYSARSIQDFWRRWHISLSTWFRDYLYIPLGGNRVSDWRVYFNLVLVFFLCGLWHGASWSFVVWGLWHGGFLVLERVGFSKTVGKASRLLQHAYVILVVLLGWVFFRAETLSGALLYIQKMFSLPQQTPTASLKSFIDGEILISLFLGLLFSFPILGKVQELMKDKDLFQERALAFTMIFLFAVCCFYLAADTYNPFIYFRF